MKDSQLLIRSLMKVRERSPSIYFTLKRQIFVMIINMTKQNEIDSEDK